MREVEARLRLSAVDRTAAAFAAVQKKLAAVEKRTQAVTRAERWATLRRPLEVTEDRMARIGRASSLAAMSTARVLAPLAFGAAAIKVIQTGSRVEAAMFAIKQKSGATREQVAGLKSEIMDLGQQVPVALDELASAYERGAAAGIPLDDLRDFAKLTAQVADNWDMSAESVANAFAGFSAGLGIKKDQWSGFADLINYLADSGIANESDIVDFLDRVGASLKNFGMKPEEAAAFGASLANLKMAPEIAARAMDTLTGKLLAPENLSKGSHSAFEQIVGDVDKFAKLANSDGTKALMEFFGKLQSMEPQKRVSLLGAFMGEGFDDEVARMVSGLDEIQRNLTLIQDKSKYEGSIAGLSEQKLDLFDSKMQLLKNSADHLGTALYDVFATKLVSGVDIGAKAIEGLAAQMDDSAAFRSGLAKQAKGGVGEQDVYGEYKRRYEAVYGPVSMWDDSSFRKSLDRDVKRYGRGQAKSPYADLEMAAGFKNTSLYPDFDEGANAAEAWRRRNAGNIDGVSLSLPSSVPTPRLSGIAAAANTSGLGEQLALYGAGREALRQYLGSKDYLASQARGTNNVAARMAADAALAEAAPSKSISQRAFEANQGVNADALVPSFDGLRGALTDGGSQAAGDIKQAIADGVAGIRQELSGVGSQIGSDAASAFRAGASGVTVGVRPTNGTLTNRNTGVSMPNAGEPPRNRGEY